MDTTEKIPRENVFALIPARLHSTRLPNKLLLPVAGKPLILHTLEQTKRTRNIDRAVVATDSREILEAVVAAGGEAVLTSDTHLSGSDRIAEVARGLPAESVVVNVQGDEPLIPPETIEKAIGTFLENDAADIVTTCEPIEDPEEAVDPDIVKVVVDNNGCALYFSRSPVPFPREAVRRHGTVIDALRREKGLLSLYRKHTGLYVYRREFLLRYTGQRQTSLEKTELLEQLRALEYGARIRVIEVAERSIGVDTQEDFDRVRNILENKILDV